MKVVDALVEANLVRTRTEGRRLICQGGVRVDGIPINDVHAEILTAGAQSATLRIGKFRGVLASTYDDGATIAFAPFDDREPGGQHVS